MSANGNQQNPGLPEHYIATCRCNAWPLDWMYGGWRCPGGAYTALPTVAMLQRASMQARQVEMLQRMPIFGAIRDDVLSFLLDHAAHRRLDAGQSFFREGEPGDRMFVLEAGRAVVVKGWQGSEVLLHHLEAGDCFGEMALMDLFPRSASVIAETDCVAIELTSESLAGLFERDLEQFALIQMNIGREVCRRLRAADDRLFRVRMGESL